jgi:arylsulfatase A
MKPNIIFILADDMGYGDFSAINGGLSQTPALDQLMSESLCLSQQYTASPVCNPSRACLMTGRYPHRTGSIDTMDWRGYERMALRETTIADVLQGAGYRTGLVGKWHLGSYDLRYHPMNRGFDETVCFRGGMQDYYNWHLEVGEKWVHGDGRYLTDVWTEEAVNFIKRNQKEPFFLHLTYNAPHTPLQAPKEDIYPFRETGMFTEELSTFYGMLKHMDQGVEQVLDTLKRCGLTENTIVLFTSDNGPQFGAGGHPPGCLRRFNCEFNGGKGSVYEGGIRVPMLLRWPDGLPGKQEFKDMVHFSDWFPTLLAMAGIDVPAGLNLDGVNVLPALRGEEGKVCTKRFWQWNRYTPLITCNAAVRDGDWKLVRPRIEEAMKVPCVDPWLKISMENPQYFLENGPIPDPIPPRVVPDPLTPELYNIRLDPLETRNLAAEYPDRAHRLLVDLENWFEEVEQERATIEDVW